MHNFCSVSPGFTKQQTTKKVVRSFSSLFWYSAGVFRDTPHESFRNSIQVSPPHRNHPSTTRIIHNSCLLCGLSEARFSKGCRARQRVYHAKNHFLFTVVLASGERDVVLCHHASAEKDHVHWRDHLCASEFAKRGTSPATHCCPTRASQAHSCRCSTSGRAAFVKDAGQWYPVWFTSRTRSTVALSSRESEPVARASGICESARLFSQ